MNFKIHFHTLLAALVMAPLLLVGAHAPAGAQLAVSTSSSSTPETTPTLPDPLTPETVRELVSTLSDQQVRDLLLERLDAVARQQAVAEGSEQSVLGVIVGAAESVAVAVKKGLSATPNMPAGVAKAAETFMGDRGASGLLLFLAIGPHH